MLTRTTWEGMIVTDNCQTISEMIVSGTNINSTLDSVTPLTIAIACRKENIVQLLLDSGVNIRADNDAAFCMAVLMQNVDLTRKLLELGANINAIPDTKFMEFMMAQSNLEMFKYDFVRNMLNTSNNFTYSFKGFLCYVAIVTGSTNSNYGLLKLLLDYNIDTRANNDITALEMLLCDPNLSVEVFKEIMQDRLINNYFTSRDISRFMYMLHRHDYTNMTDILDILDMLKEYVDPIANDYILEFFITNFMKGEINE
jgi:ankyrin repeat protein